KWARLSSTPLGPRWLNGSSKSRSLAHHGRMPEASSWGGFDGRSLTFPRTKTARRSLAAVAGRRRSPIPSASATRETAPSRSSRPFGPASSTKPSSTQERICPPTRSEASSRVTGVPRARRAQASVRPEMPAPTTTVRSCGKDSPHRGTRAIGLATRAAAAYVTAMRFVVTGANRGIGLEFVKQLTARGEDVDATARDPEDAAELRALARPGVRLAIHRLDVADDASVAAFAEELAPGPVDVLINNAGVSGVKGGELIDPADVLRVLNVNAVGTLRVVRALLPRLREGKGRRIVNLTSKLGSIAEASGGRYAYRSSKAALNMVTKLLAEDLRAEGFRTVGLHPGWVQTRMGGSAAPVPPDQSIQGMLRIIDSLTAEESGRAFDFQGQEIPW